MAEQPQTLYEGKHLNVARRGTWEYATRPKIDGIVMIVAVTDDHKLLLVEQERAPVGRRVIELPAGLAGDEPGTQGEDLAVAARRELREETGYEAAEMVKVAEGPPSAGMTDEIITVFRATRLKRVGEAGGVEGEDIRLHEVPVAGVRQWLAERGRAGLMIDLKIYAGLYFVEE